MECVCSFDGKQVTSMCGAHVAAARKWAEETQSAYMDRMNAKLEAVERERDEALKALGRHALRHG